MAVCVTAVSLSFESIYGDTSEIVDKHVQYLKSHLSDKNEHISADALDALATFDVAQYIDDVRKAVDDSSELIQHVGLTQIRRHANAGDLRRIRDLILQIQTQTKSKEDFAATVTELLSLEVLLDSDDPKMSEFAIQQIRQELATQKLSFAMWDGLVDLVGDHSITELQSLVRSTATDETRAIVAAPALAKTSCCN